LTEAVGFFFGNPEYIQIPDCTHLISLFLFHFFEDGCVLGAPVFNAFGVIPQFPAIVDKLLAETARLAAKLHGAYNSLQVPLPDLQGAGQSPPDRTQSAGKVLWKSSRN